MRNIFYGLLFIFLDFNLNLGNSTIGLIPDFVGYLLMLKGIGEMLEESEYFHKSRPFAVGMAIYTGVLYVMDLLGITKSLDFLGILLGMGTVIISLYITYNIIMGVLEIETNKRVFLNGEKIRSVWKVVAVFEILTYVTMLIPIVGFICVIASLILNIIFLVEFNKGKTLYEELN